jgi:hypothetical protein
MLLYSVVLCFDYKTEEWEGRKEGRGMSVRFLDTRERSRESVCIYHYTVLYSALKRAGFCCVSGTNPFPHCLALPQIIICDVMRYKAGGFRECDECFWVFIGV